VALAANLRQHRAGDVGSHGPQHGLLHHVVGIGVAVQRPADDVVRQRQVLGQQGVQGLAVTALRGDDHVHAGPIGSDGSHRTSMFSGVSAPLHIGDRRDPWCITEIRAGFAQDPAITDMPGTQP